MVEDGREADVFWVDLTPMAGLHVNFSLLFKLRSLDPRAFPGKRRDRRGGIRFPLHANLVSHIIQQQGKKHANFPDRHQGA
jgi:hypothetical protein